VSDELKRMWNEEVTVYFYGTTPTKTCRMDNRKIPRYDNVKWNEMAQDEIQ
jgi:hypothetical protein